MRVESSGALPAGLRASWAALTDWERQPEWMFDAATVRVLGARRRGPGVRVAVRTRVLGIPAFTEVLEVVHWKPSRELEVSHSGLIRGTGRWRLEPAGRGVTTFTWTEDVRIPVPVLGELALFVYRPFMRRLMRRAIAALAARLAG